MPTLYFARTRAALDTLSDDARDAAYSCALSGVDWVVSTGPFNARPFWRDIAFTEAVGVRPNATQATPYEPDNDEQSRFDLEPPSHDLCWQINHDIADDGRPSFGRRMVLIDYNPEATESDQRRVSSALTQSLMRPRTVWHARSFESIGFIDSRRGEAIRDALAAILDVQAVIDYLFVEPTHMVETDPSGLSPLGTWISATGGSR